MKVLKDILAENVPTYYRFQIFLKEENRIKKTIGMAYLREGQTMYTLRLWTFLDEKFFLLPSKDDHTKYLLMTREPNKTPLSKNKYFWNIVGNAKANIAQTVIELNFDLLDKKIYLSVFPETSSHPRGLSAPEEHDLAA